MSSEELFSGYPVDPGIASLVERFPRLFKGKAPPWSELPAGWVELTQRMFADLDGVLDDSAASAFEVLQIKEKFAALRVYWELAEAGTTVIQVTSAMDGLRTDHVPRDLMLGRIRARVEEAREEAATICQRCGNGGASLVGHGRVKTLCKRCANKEDWT